MLPDGLENFYSLLRSYNLSLRASKNILPEWFDIFSEKEPPNYWVVLANILKKEDKNSFVLEIGSGFGDVVALAKCLGFKNVIGVEQEQLFATLANEKIRYFFGENDSIICNKYPIQLERPPDILIQVNCVYFENITTKKQMVSQIKEWYYANGIPQMYILELIDSGFTEKSKTFPQFVRFSEQEVKEIFWGRTIHSFITYQFPQNKSTKRLYLIKQ